jgi:hypothetical protein
VSAAGERPRLTIVSGGQSGVDRAALDVAQELGLECGGWCPAGRWAEDGPIDDRYPLRPTPSSRPAQRTEWNVRDSDATLIIAIGPLAGGTALTRRIAERLGRPALVLDPRQDDAVDAGRRWLDGRRVTTLNVAGPRESTSPGIHDRAAALLRGILAC